MIVLGNGASHRYHIAALCGMWHEDCLSEALAYNPRSVPALAFPDRPCVPTQPATFCAGKSDAV